MTGDANGIAQIAEYLERFVKMQAYNIINNSEWKEKTNGEKIYFLHQMGFANEDIEFLVGSTLGNVKKEISLRKN